MVIYVPRSGALTLGKFPSVVGISACQGKFSSVAEFPGDTMSECVGFNVPLDKNRSFRRRWGDTVTACNKLWSLCTKSEHDNYLLPTSDC